MRAVVYDRFGAPPVVTEIERPQCPPHGAVIKVEATGVCRSDWHGWQGHDADITELPHVPGHELAGEVRAVGHAALSETVVDVDVSRYVETPMISPPPRADESSLAGGTHLGTVREHVTPEGHAAYLHGIGETLPVYQQFVHPGALLRMVNAVLFRNVAMGPWIHTSSVCRYLAPAPVPTTLTAHGVVTDRYERNGKSYVRFDALVLAGERPVVEVDHVAIYDLGAGGA